MIEVETRAIQEIIKISQMDNFEINMLVWREVRWFQMTVISDSNSNDEGKKLELVAISNFY